MVETQALTILLAAPRGFCAGVDRAIQIVERSLEKYGAPVYVRHEIVHNKFVVDSLKAKGAVFVEELSQIPDDGQPVIFSAHGVPKSVPERAEAREMSQQREGPSMSARQSSPPIQTATGSGRARFGRSARPKDTVLLR